MSATDWQKRILSQFVPGVSPIILAADPDGLLQNEHILAGLQERGFSLLWFEDPIAFRYAYESRFRGREQGEKRKGLVVLAQVSAAELDKLPYDILAKASRLTLGLAELFPKLNGAVVSTLEPADLDALYDAHARHATEALGEVATKEFALRHVFGIDAELVQTPVDLLRVLLQRHYPGRRVPPELDQWFIAFIQGRFEKWPLRNIVPDREAFFDFLQERWPEFLDGVADNAPGIADGESCSGYSAPPNHLPFAHEDIRVYMDNLFAEGLLQPVAHQRVDALREPWLQVGIYSRERQQVPERLGQLLASATEQLPEQGARHDDWFRFAQIWAELIALSLASPSESNEGRQREIAALRTRMDAEFARWVASGYASLANLPPEPPVMLHHIPRFLARQLRSPADKAALVVMDGLALDQWVVLRQELTRQRPHWQFREGAVCAWAPTITSVSRQAIFAGEPPQFFPDSIHNTNRERALWKRFWAEQNMTSVAYARGLSADEPVDEAMSLIEGPDIRVVGLVVNKVDDIMHGMTLGTAGMHNQVRQWAAQSHFAALLDLLFERDFRVYLTADHGNIEAAGCGRPAEGAVAEIRGERARVYSDESLRRGVAERFPEAWEWPAYGLPENYLPLLAPGRLAFVGEGERVVAHGGVCLEELIVPFVQVEQGG